MGKLKKKIQNIHYRIPPKIKKRERKKRKRKQNKESQKTFKNERRLTGPI